MKPSLRNIIRTKTRLFAVVSGAIVSGAALLLISCSSSDSQAPAEAIPNSEYYETLKSASYIDNPLAQPPTNEIFSENTKHFVLDLVPAKQLAKMAAAQTLSTDVALYVPRGLKPAALAKSTAKSAAAAVVPGSGIPSFKPADIIPDVCSGLSGNDLRQCLDDNSIGLAPPPVHISYHDPQTLSILLGAGFNDKLLANLHSSFITHIDKPTQDTISAKLNNYITSNPSHTSLNLAQQNIFDPSGFYISNAVITDGSQGYSNNDGVLVSHSTLIVELKKPLNYTRAANSALDDFIKKYSSTGAVPVERYEITLKAYIHLDQLASFRQPLPEPSQDTMTTAEQLAFYEQILRAQTINHAFDTNVIKKIIGSGEVLPWSCTEYTVSFQLSTDTIADEYAPMLEKATSSDDTAAIEAIENHIDAQTALITGSAMPLNGVQKSAGSLTVMYQVSMPKAVAKAGTSGGYDYAMVDSLGRRVAIYDPVTGTTVSASSESRSDPGTDKQVAMTAAACQGDTSNWAYLPHSRTPRFGRGIQWILAEWLIHNQVGDYKNIHWYQSVWKSGTQVAIKGGTFIFTTYLKLQSGAVEPDKGGLAAVYLLETALPYFANVISNMGGRHSKDFKIAGYSLSGVAFVSQLLAEKAVTNPTFLERMGARIKNFVIGFVIDRLGQGLGQMLDVTAVGWQDFSDGSHLGCFKFD